MKHAAPLLPVDAAAVHVAAGCVRAQGIASERSGRRARWRAWGHTVMSVVLLWGCAGLGGIRAQVPFRLMAYNVENLFDTRPDMLADDREFLPDAPRRWTPARYWNKLNDVARVIAAVGQEVLPAVVALCEVENDSVLHDLTCRSPLRTAGYRYVMTASADHRGIDVAMLYQPGLFRLLATRSIRIPSVRAGFAPTRDILYVAGRVPSGDTLHVFVCHLPSRVGGSRRSRRHRALAAATLQEALDSVWRLDTAARIVVAGDFNATPGDVLFRRQLRVRPALRDGEALPPTARSRREESFAPATAAERHAPGRERSRRTARKRSVAFGAELAQSSLAACTLYQTIPSDRASRRAPVGSYRYRGEWSYLDHVLVSDALLDTLATFACRLPVRLNVADFPYLLEGDVTYGGKRPRRTYQGPVYRGGVSDHLPVFLDFVWHRR